MGWKLGQVDLFLPSLDSNSVYKFSMNCNLISIEKDCKFSALSHTTYLALSFRDSVANNYVKTENSRRKRELPAIF